MSRAKRLRSRAKAPASLWRWVALWTTGLVVGSVAIGLFLFGAPERAPAPDRWRTAAVETPRDQASRGQASDRVDGVPTAETQSPSESAEAKPGSKSARLEPPPSKLDQVYAKLFKLESKEATGPLTILHLGDSHIASDRITGEVRRLLQARFGNAGRGLMMPGFPFPYYKAPGFSFEKAGTWKAANSLTEDGPYGITGVSLTGGASEAVLKLASTDGPFASAEVWLLAGPDRGRAVISAGTMRKEVATAADKNSVLRVTLPVRASSLKIEVMGDGPVTVFGWSADDNHPGIRYVNLGIPSASALTTNRFDRRLAASDIRALAPDLIVLGYGTNEGFNDDLDLAAYEQDYERLIKLVIAAAPEAALAILGPADGNRLPRFVKGKRRGEAPCRPLSAAERADYGERLSHEDPELARWHEPPKLDEVRALLAKMADRHGATYWNLSGMMGGPCSIHRWLLSEPPLALPDHVHLSDVGSKRLGRALYQSLMSGYDRYRQQASAAGDFANVAGRGARPPEEP